MTHIFAIDTFAADRNTVPGPRELGEDHALSYLAQRMADQHRGGLTLSYWRRRAQLVLAEAAAGPGVACIHRIACGARCHRHRRGRSGRGRIPGPRLPALRGRRGRR